MNYEFWFWITILFVTHLLAIIMGYKAGMVNGEASGINWARNQYREIKAMEEGRKNADT